MSYEPTNWKDRVVEKPRTFNMQNNPDGTVTLTPAPGTVVQEGTPVNAANLNKIEQGFVSHLAESVTDIEGVHGFEVETGTWTPEVGGDIVKGENTHNLQEGYYIKQGNLCFVRCNVRITAKDTSNPPSGVLRVYNLPFSPISPDNGVQLQSIGQLTLPSGAFQIGGSIELFGGVIFYASRDTGNPAAISITQVGDAFNVKFTCLYRIE